MPSWRATVLSDGLHATFLRIACILGICYFRELEGVNPLNLIGLATHVGLPLPSLAIGLFSTQGK